MTLLDVQWLLPDGGAGGRTAEGSVVRLSEGIPGDRVRFSTTRRRGNTLHGVVDEILEPSSARREPPCPWHSACGGCDLGHMATPERREALAHVAGRSFGIERPVMVPSPRQQGHRARIDLSIVDGRVGYRRKRSSDLVEVTTCGIARPEVQDALHRLRNIDLRHFERVEIRSNGTRAIFAFTGKRGAPAPMELEHVAINGRRVRGDPVLTLDVLGIPLQASPRSFYQVNLEVNALLVAEVTAAASGHERVLDLYAGIGNLSLPIADQGIAVTAVELEGQAIHDLRARTNGRPVRAVSADVGRFDTSTEAFDCLILDPPRAGAPGVLKRAALNRPKTVIYVSCNAPAAARDLRELPDYRLHSVTCFEMFPDTHHFETLIVLKRD
jgi:23S rRNA (uracil1939-C5)-methyltransferase